MNRPTHIWLLFTACFAVLLAAMAWVSLATLRLDRERMEATQQESIEENVRLALWRMDSFLNAVVVEESARPFTAWESFSSREQVFTKSYDPIKQGEILTPSPLLSFASSNVLLHFQLASEGRLTCPQAPTGAERNLALKGYSTSDRIASATTQLGKLKALLNQQCFPPPDSELAWSSSTQGQPMPLNRDLLIVSCSVFRTNTVGPIYAPAISNLAALTDAKQELAPSQVALNSASKNSAEWQARAKVQQAAQGSVLFNNPVPPNQQQFEPTPAAAQRPTTPAKAAALPRANFDSEGLFRPLWLGSELVLARRVNFSDHFVVQGVWLNWTNLKHSLLGSISDLFPAANIQPASAAGPQPHTRMLAAIPAMLVPGPATLPPLPAWTSSRSVLVVAWLGVLLAAVAVAVLLHGAVSLSERRAAFVSAVTHELRTPLTTFKMYSEMLAEDMVPDAEKRKSYLGTLCSEANRLSHLVENVLAYARLERGSARSRVERVSLGQLIKRVQDRLDQRAGHAGMKLVVDAAPATLETSVHVDVSAVEQILFNLVDNACKYAAPTASEKLIHLEALPDGKFAMLRVRDHGQGITTEGAKRLFQPFSKSAHEAAHSAPGVGLGLALCRRLSRSMGGDLRHNAASGGGACFILTLPLSTIGDTPAPASIA